MKTQQRHEETKAKSKHKNDMKTQKRHEKHKKYMKTQERHEKTKTT